MKIEKAIKEKFGYSFVELSTRIEIEYNGAYAICKVNGKYFNECDSFTKVKALGAFRCIEQDFRRTNNGNKNLI